MHAGYALIQLLAMNHLPTDSKLIQSFRYRFDTAIFAASLDPHLLQTFRLTFEDGLNRMPAKNVLFRHGLFS